MEVIFAVDAHGAGFELHVEVFGDEDDGVAALFPQPEGAGEDAMIHFFLAGKDPLKLLQAAQFIGLLGIVDDDAEVAAAGRADAVGDGGVGRGEDFHEGAMDFAGIGATFGHLDFEAVQFAEDIDRNADPMLGKAVDAGGVVKEDVGVEDEDFGADGSTDAALPGGGAGFSLSGAGGEGKGRGGTGIAGSRDEGRGYGGGVVVAVHVFWVMGWE